MQGYAYAIVERNIVQNIDTQKVCSVNQPFFQRNSTGLEVQVSPTGSKRKMLWESGQGDEEELKGGDQRAGRG